MKLRSKKSKPPVGMEMTVTLSMPAEATLEESRSALLAFFEGVRDLGAGAAWVRINCRGIPPEFEERMQEALDAANAALEASAPKLRLVVNNDDGRAGAAEAVGGDDGRAMRLVQHRS